MNNKIKLILIIVCLTTRVAAQSNHISLIMDLVHNNPGEPLYDTRYDSPQVLKEMGYNAKCFYLFDSPTLAINWDSFDKNILPLGTPDREWVDKKAARLHGLYNECKRNGIDVYAMSDLILLPKRLIKLYNIENSYGDAQNEMTQKILRYQIQEIFRQFPQMDGLVVRIGETYLQDAPFHQGNIQNKTDADKCIIPLMNLLREEICVKLNKKLVFRTWWVFDTDEKKYQYVSDNVEPHPNMTIAVKHCEGDFHRGNPYSKVQGMGRHQQLIEVQCAREYEGKGAYPNYIGRGVIEGFEEDYWRKKEGKAWNMRDIYDTGILTGVWTWSRGGGWEGPYPKNELWCDLNAWVLAQWANNPEASEESIFNRYSKKVLKLKAKEAKKFRKLALLSESATLRGMRSVQYPNDIFSMWVRDEYITFPNLPNDIEKINVLLAEKDEAENEWNEIVRLSKEINVPDKYIDEVMKVTCIYGQQMYRIYHALFYLSAIKQGIISNDKQQFLDEYDDAWDNLNRLEINYPTTCPSLYSKTIIRRTRTIVADKVVNEMR